MNMQFFSCFLLYVLSFLFDLCVTVSINKIPNYTPVHVHISFGNTLSDIFVTWETASKTKESLVFYGTNGLINRTEGHQIAFQDGGPEKRKFYIHRVLLTNLEPNTTYEYHCGSNLGWSDLFFFQTPLTSTDWSPHFAIFGDMGAENAQSLPYLQREAQEGLYNAIFHVGDMAYNMDSDNGRIGDAFMQQIEPIAAYVPYMTAVGNHEGNYNFSHYRLRFTMPGDSQGLFYSFNMGPIHFIVISTEVYYFLKYGVEPVKNQFEWLNKDLEEATSPQNRSLRPWIITMGHRPMYCSNNDKDDCTYTRDTIRVGIPVFGFFGLEDLFYRYGVDVEIWAHEHSYERTWPLYNYQVYNGTADDPYLNPEAPVHVISGSAGCNEYVDNFKSKVGNWSAFRSSDYGYTRLKVHNTTHLHFEQVSVNKDGMVIDHFWLVKHRHGPYPKRNKSIRYKKYKTFN